MDADNDVTVDSGTAGAAPSGPAGGGPRRNAWPWVNWGLALALVPAAAIVMLFALGAVMGTAGCSEQIGRASCRERV